MRTARFLLIASLLGNLALVTVLVRRTLTGHGDDAMLTPPVSSDRSEGARMSALQAALASGDLAALTAAGCPPDAIRMLSVGRAFDRLTARARALRASPTTDGRYWRRFPGSEASRFRQAQLERTQTIREFTDTVRTFYGEDLNTLFGGGREGRYSYLAPAKRDKLRQIEQDYAEMVSQIYVEQSDVQLPADAAKLKLLRAERQRDIDAAMTPDDRLQYELHDSDAARETMSRYGAALETEADYQKVYALQKAYNDRFQEPDGPLTAEQIKERRSAETQLRSDIDALLTADQRAALRRANDQDYTTLGTLAQRLNLPASITDDVIALRSSYAAQSLQINANASLSDQERRQRLQALAAQARTDLQPTLGADGAQAYAKRASWIAILRDGAAFSTNPADAGRDGQPGVYLPIYRVRPASGEKASPPGNDD